jgi:phospholipid/cholesterol/gamma-HCH transport system permease protein
MALSIFVEIGRRERESLSAFGRFWVFVWETTTWTVASLGSRRSWRLLMPQLFEVGNRSVPVILVTGLFVGLVLAVQAYAQLASMGLQERLGVLVNLSLVKELGPVLAGVMLAGRVGGALVAELGTMRVTEQIDALRSMGTDPVRYLVVPRVVACILLTPILTWYCDLMGALGGYLIAVKLYGVGAEPYLFFTKDGVVWWDMFSGFVKSVFFGAILAVIACYKGFNCRAGAEGVGRACTEAFVASFIAILVIDFFLGVLMQGMYKAIWGFQPLL